VKALRTFAWITAAGLFLLVIFGFVVTYTGSGRGCGGTWPLCHGKLIPLSFTFHTVIEFAHRSLAGIVGILVLILFIWAWRRAGRLPFVKVLASAGLLFVIVQAIIGGLDVLHPESASILALHFGFSVISFAAVAILAMALGQDTTSLERLPEGSPEAGTVRTLSVLMFIVIYGVAYLGAYVSHLGSGDACLGWPLCNGAWLPSLTGDMGIVFFHRLTALVAFIIAIRLHMSLRPFRPVRRDLTQASHTLLGGIFLEMFSGAYLVWADFSTFALLIHVTLMVIVFTAASYLFLHAVLGLRETRRPKLG